MKPVLLFTILATLFTSACNNDIPKTERHPEEEFSAFETRFLDNYWKQYPSLSITIGYGKYYENLVIPENDAYTRDILFSRQWLDSLNTLDFLRLSDNNKISYNIIKNQLESDIWYKSKFKQQEWDASLFNLSNECYYLIHQPYAPLGDRLKILSRHIENADLYYQAAF